MASHDADRVDHIDRTPLRAVASTGYSHAVRRPHDRLVTLAPVTVIPWLGAGISLAVLLAGAGIYSTSGHPGGLFIGGLGALGTVALAGIALGSRRFDFDRVRGELRVRRFGMTRTYPLDRIRAVQLIPGGWHAGASQRPGFYSYQMNLVLADPPRPRLNVTDTANWDKTWETGSTLAGFLKVPLLHDGEPE